MINERDESKTSRPIAFDAYEDLADAYAAHIDTKPHNAFYERPATRSLLPDVKNKRVLDAGCGPGVYSEWLLNQGADVVALDSSPKMVALAKKRTSDRADVCVADLEAPLSFLSDASFDVVLSTLVLEYVRDWRATFAEFRRVLKPAGHLVISVTHPFFDSTYFKTEKYFDTELVHSEWRGFGPRVRMPSYRRSLEETLNPFGETGFLIQRMLEPKPTLDFKAADPRHYDELMRSPCFLCIRAMKAEMTI